MEEDTLHAKLREMKEHKRKRKELDRLFDENWDKKKFKGDNEQRKQDSSDSENEKEPKKNGSKSSQSKKPRSKPTKSKTTKKSPSYMEEEFRTELVNESKKTTTKKTQLSTETKQMNAKPIDRHLGDKPLVDWMLTFCKSNNKSPSELKKDLLQALNDEIDSMASGDKPKKKDKKKATNVKNNEQKEMNKTEFFKYDEDKDPFGLKSPYDYSLMKKLEEEYKKKEQLYLNEARDLIKDAMKKKKIDLEFQEIEECSKAHCSDFLREPMNQSERPCRRREKCICMVLATLHPDSIEDSKPEEGFIAREFLTPRQLAILEKYKTLPEEEQLCLLCKRLLTTSIYYYNNKNNIEPIEIIQDHCNKVDQVGEYSKDNCLVPVFEGKKWNGIVRPIVKFSTSNYIYSKHESKSSKTPIKCIIEQNLDFFF